MTTLGWITVGGLAMSALALSGSLTLLLPERLFHRVVPRWSPSLPARSSAASPWPGCSWSTCASGR